MRKKLLSHRSSVLFDEEPIINLTPLIDVVFVVLIMFIVIAPILDYEEIHLANAGDHQAQAHSVASESPITLRVSSDNRILLNGECVHCEGLVKRLQELKVKYPEATPQLFQDKRSHFGTYQQIKNAAESAGFTTMDLILIPS